MCLISAESKLAEPNIGNFGKKHSFFRSIVYTIATGYFSVIFNNYYVFLMTNIQLLFDQKTSAAIKHQAIVRKNTTLKQDKKN